MNSPAIIFLIFFFFSATVIKNNDLLILDFDEDHKKQKVYYEDDGKDMYFLYMIDQNPFEVHFRFKQELNKDSISNLGVTIRDYEWFNSNYGGTTNIESLKKTGAFIEQYKTFVIFNRKQNRYCEVSLITMISH